MHDRLRASTVLEVYERRFEIFDILPAKLGNKALHGSGPPDAMTLFTGSCFFSARTSGGLSVDCRNPRQEKSSKRG